MAITAPAELAAAATVINSWDASINQAVWYSVFIVVIMALSFSPVKAYGESEVFFAALKILLIVGLILAGIMVDLVIRRGRIVLASGTGRSLGRSTAISFLAIPVVS